MYFGRLQNFLRIEKSRNLKNIQKFPVKIGIMRIYKTDGGVYNKIAVCERTLTALRMEYYILKNGQRSNKLMLPPR